MLKEGMIVGERYEIISRIGSGDGKKKTGDQSGNFL